MNCVGDLNWNFFFVNLYIYILYTFRQASLASLSRFRLVRPYMIKTEIQRDEEEETVSKVKSILWWNSCAGSIDYQVL